MRTFIITILACFLLAIAIYADILTGLVGYWPFNDGSGSTALDGSGNGNNGTLFNTPTWGSANIGGDLTFNGTNQYVKVNQNAAIEPATAITVSIWANISNANAGIFVDIIRKAAASGVGYLLRWSHSDGKLQLRVDRTIGTSFTVVDTQLNTAYLNNWHLFTATYDSGTGNAILYVDGVTRQTTSGLSGNLEHSSDLYIMGNTLDSTFITGSAQDVRIYNRALTQSDIVQLFNATRPPNVLRNCTVRNARIGG